MTSDARNNPELQKIPGERAFVAEILRTLRHVPGSVPLGDDCAPLDHDRLVWTTDMLMDGVDFLSAAHDWEAIGYKSLAVSVSDCAAMGAIPTAALLAVSLHEDTALDDARALLRGAVRCAEEFDIRITGGDTNSWRSPTVIAFTVAARLPDNVDPWLRSGAQVGDLVCITGPVGGSLLGRHLTPRPRVREAAALRAAGGPTAAIDISDGLALDLWRVCEASRCGAVLDADQLDHALHPDATRRAAQTGATPREHGLYDGEDFELIVTLPPERMPAAHAAVSTLRPIGAIIPEQTLLLEEAGRRRTLEIRGWEHLRGD